MFYLFTIDERADWQSIAADRLLDRKVEKLTVSKKEIDILAAFILNRSYMAAVNETVEHANPGIAFIWSDERARRSQMADVRVVFIISKFIYDCIYFNLGTTV